ncbi:MAG TPA: HAD-IIB family hydrolase [Candidatus Cloacimonetes bacterium]|nr:HAD-IIB family hydrolase [Candidatus Cloacimonadota bacterium]
MNNSKIIFTDLDRTLLKDDNSLSEKNLEALLKIQERKIITVIATGRNILSAKRVLTDDLPFDYLIFSSGAGIIDWKSKKVIYENHLIKREIDLTLEILLRHKVDFMIHEIIPENHKFFYGRINKENPDFERRIRLYQHFAQPLKQPLEMKKASQFIAVLQENSETKFNEIKSEIKELKVIRATSPLDHRSIWLEVFPKKVSKGHSAEWLGNYLKIKREDTVGIGNDFNDLDLLHWTAQSYVVENSPAELKTKFRVIKSNEEDGFAEITEKILNTENLGILSQFFQD